MQTLVGAFEFGHLGLGLFGGFLLPFLHVHADGGGQLLELLRVIVARLLQATAFGVHIQYLCNHGAAVEALHRQTADDKLGVGLDGL